MERDSEHVSEGPDPKVGHTIPWDRSFLLTLDKRTGRVRWKAMRRNVPVRRNPLSFRARFLIKFGFVVRRRSPNLMRLSDADRRSVNEWLDFDRKNAERRESIR